MKDHQKDHPQLPVGKQPWAKPQRLQELVANSQMNLRKVFPKVQRAMQLYLAHRETEFILFRPIRVRSRFHSQFHLIAYKQHVLIASKQLDTFARKQLDMIVRKQSGMIARKQLGMFARHHLANKPMHN